MPARNKPKLNLILLRWFVITGIVSAVLSIGIYTALTYRSMRDFANLNLTTLREQQTFLLENWFMERTQDIFRLSLTPALKDNDPQRIIKLLSSYTGDTDGGFNSCFFADINGNVLVDPTQEGSRMYVGDCKYFKEAMKGVNCVSDIIQNWTDGFPTIVFASPVYSNGNIICGVVFGGVTLSRLNELIASFRFGETGETYLVDKKGIMLTESRFTPLLREKGLVRETTQYSFNAGSPGVVKVINEESGFQEYRNYRNALVLGSYCWLPDREWGLVVEIEKKEIHMNWLSQISIIAGVILLIMIIVIVPLARYLAGKTVLPLTRLTDRLNMFTEDYKSDVLSWAALEAPVYQEIDRLGQSFFSMGEKIGQLMDNMEIQAQHDALTGLANRHYFSKRGQQIIELIQRNKRVCSLIFLDIDRFKSVNDTYGHAVGDSVLIKLGEILEKNVRISDVVGRFGGEEFTMILPDTDLEGAKLLAERLRQKVEQTLIVAGEEELSITVSMGIAVYYGGKERINRQDIMEKLISKADQAMYRAKENGRNRVEVFQDEDTDKQLKLFLAEDDNVV